MNPLGDECLKSRLEPAFTPVAVPIRPKVAAVILNYNEFEHTRECIESVRRVAYSPLALFVIDGGSTDDSQNRLRQLLDPDEFVALSVNGGYSYGNNVGMARAFRSGADFVLVINNDTVLDQFCVPRLVDIAIADPRIGIVGPKVLYYSRPDTINFAGIKGVVERANYSRVGLYESDSGQYEEVIDTLYQDGCAFLISRGCFDRIGGFDDWLWTYSEESDLCFRARSAGFRVCCHQQAKIWHKVSATMGSGGGRKPHAEFYITRNEFLFHRRYVDGLLNRVIVTAILLIRSLRNLAVIAVKPGPSRIQRLLMHCVGAILGLTTDIDHPSDAIVKIKAAKSTRRVGEVRIEEGRG